MKIWEILKEPKDLAIYKATNTVDSWEGVEIQVKVDDKEYATIHYVTLPRISSFKSVSVGRVIPLVGAVTKADWEYVKTEKLPFDDFTITFTEFARCLMHIVRMERNQYVKSKMLIDYFLEMEHSISNVLIELEKQRDNVLRKAEIGGEQERILHDMKTLYLAVEKLPILFRMGEINKIVEHSELTLSLLYSTFVHVWGEGYWNDTIRCHLTKEEMLLLAHEEIEKTKRG